MNDKIKKNPSLIKNKNPQVPTKIDILSRYLQEIQKYPLLSSKEEKQIAIEYYKTKDPKLAFRLVSSNFRLVVKIAFEYSNYTAQVMDLIQEGNIGLVHAVKKFDPFRGVRLSVYAQHWIRSYIIYYLLNNFRLVKIGTTQAQRRIFFNLQKERRNLLNMGFDPTPKLIATKLDVPEETVVEMMERMGSCDVSIDAPLSSSADEDKKSTLLNIISGGESPEKVVSEKEILNTLKEKIFEFGKKIKNERDKFIWEKRLLAEEPITLQEIGDIYNISRERARQLEEKIKKELKQFLSKEIGREVITLSFLDRE